MAGWPTLASTVAGTRGGGAYKIDRRDVFVGSVVAFLPYQSEKFRNFRPDTARIALPGAAFLLLAYFAVFF